MEPGPLRDENSRMAHNRLGRTTISILTALALLLGAGVTSSTFAGEADAKKRVSRGYVIKPCVVKALHGRGLQGNGCDVYSTPYVASYATAAEATRNSKAMWKFVYRCVASGAVSLILTPGAGLPAAAAACVTSVIVQ